MSKNVIFDGTNLPIREFKLENMVPYATICMIAKRASGKSWIVRAILDYNSDIPGGIIISPTDKKSSFFGKFFPGLYIHYSYSSQLIGQIFHRQEEILEKRKKYYKLKKKIDPRTYIIMDDCLSSKGTWLKDPMILELFFNGRHSKILYILTMQFPLGISPDLRANFDYIFLLAEDTVSNQKRIHEHYAGMFTNLNTFQQVFKELTANYGSMVVVNRGSTTEITDKIFYYKAGQSNPRKMGCTQFNKFHVDNYNKNWLKDSQKIAFNAENYIEGNKKGKIIVKKWGDD